MNILEAIKSGKRFRRPIWIIYYSANQEEFFELTDEDILATDWEVEEEDVKVTITAAEFDAAVQKLSHKYYINMWYWADDVKKELGL